HQTLTDNSVTIRYRDSMEQERIPVDNLENIISEKLSMKNLLKKLL
ncbi:MAG TPA: His/Gly/Thr/Pro-type tRNA ligase C-terminal domain-containing protein, partial [Bacteroidales bacterium]|nr:His/Gly/Thr/Pro-type tRNA ligase C-terminal domain-containing protein [Bacteroidales bacterium]